MIVIDASAVVELLLGTPVGRRVTTHIEDSAVTLHVPELCSVEVAQVMRRLVARGEISGERAGEALADFHDLDATRHGHDVLLRRVFELRHNLTAYDAVYVALAEALGAPLLTLDTGIAGAPHRAQVVTPH